MSGEWLKFEKATLDKPEVLAVAAALGWDADMAVGKFVRMWSWFDTHTVDGDARGVTPALLDSILRVTGFVSEVQKVGWLEVHEWGIRLPRFDVHCGETAKKRALGAKRNAAYRASNAKGDAHSVTSASPREEKKREEKKKEEKILSVSATPKPDDVPAEAILAGYRELLPSLPQPRKLDPDRKKKIIARWREDRERQSLDWWRNFWAYVAQSDFLTGRDGKWQSCNLDWLLEPKNMRKVTEGNYENRGNA